MDFTDFASRIAAAAIAGLLIGVEREYKNKNAGLKTNALVALGSAVFVLVSLQFEGDKWVDTSRVLSQVVVGIGFLGAGVIWKKGGEIEGLTTAATVWCSAAVGCLAALAMYEELALITVVILIINLIFGYFDNKIKKEGKKDFEET
ncbi:MAG TPA: MgtC/SapB family protein [Flavobacteriaceae bacterium]|nr:MgtC/SapB family protein [Flavobacteriaceae bacterium]